MAAQIDLNNVEELTWLGSSGLSTDCQTNPTPLSSLHLAVGALPLRHHLPYRLCGKMELFTVTGDLTVLSGLSSLGVSVLMGNNQGVSGTGRATKVVVDGIDEFITSEDWSRAYKDFIRPLLGMKNEERGAQPHGRLAPDLERLRMGSPLYWEWLNTHSVTKLSTG